MRDPWSLFYDKKATIFVLKKKAVMLDQSELWAIVPITNR